VLVTSCPLCSQVDWDTWFYAPGMPPVTNEYDTTLATKAYDLAKSWHTSDLMGVGSECFTINIQDLPTHTYRQTSRRLDKQALPGQCHTSDLMGVGSE
jgi:leukotriene-A4 hydrolase